MNIDMAFMVYVARERGLVTEEEKLRIINCMLALELPVWHQDCTLALVQRALAERLKHSGGVTRMPLPTGLGCAGKKKILYADPCNPVMFTCVLTLSCSSSKSFVKEL